MRPEQRPSPGGSSTPEPGPAAFLGTRVIDGVTAEVGNGQDVRLVVVGILCPGPPGLMRHLRMAPACSFPTSWTATA